MGNCVTCSQIQRTIAMPGQGLRFNNKVYAADAGEQNSNQNLMARMNIKDFYKVVISIDSENFTYQELT